LGQLEDNAGIEGLLEETYIACTHMRTWISSGMVSCMKKGFLVSEYSTVGEENDCMSEREKIQESWTTSDKKVEI
jgi:hypothetical protein